MKKKYIITISVLVSLLAVYALNSKEGKETINKIFKILKDALKDSPERFKELREEVNTLLKNNNINFEIPLNFSFDTKELPIDEE